MFKRKIINLIALLIIFALLSGCGNSGNTSSDTLSKPQENTSLPALTELKKNISGITCKSDFNAAAQSVILDNGKSILQSELFYTKTGINSYSEAYGNLQDTLEYTMYNKDGQIKEISSIYISSDVSETKLPDKIKFSDSFTGTLDALNITEMVKNRDDERYFKIQNDDKSEVSLSFLSYHGRPVNTDFLTASATIYFSDEIEENDDTGKVHKYYESINLTYAEGKLKSISYYVRDEYESPDEQKIDNKKIGIRFINPEYKGEDYKIRLEEFYYEDGKINTIYSVKTNSKKEIKASYEGWQSADNGILHEILTHTVNGEESLSDCIDEPFAASNKPSWYDSLYKNYMYFKIGLPYMSFQVEFMNGAISIYRGTSR